MGNEENSFLADALRYLSGGLQRMAYIANIELCKELYELSGWKGMDTVSYRLVEEKFVATHPFDDRVVDETAIYDLGYLLRKLGNRHVELKRPYNNSEPINRWSCTARYDDGEEIEAADTPEDAACILAIRLFQQGILKGIREWQ